MNAYFKLLPEAVWVESLADKRAILAAMAARFAAVYALDEGLVLEGLQEREALGSTGFGRGVALPHARIGGLGRPVATLLKLESPVDFAAADRLPVELVIGLLSPTNAGATHLHALAALSEFGGGLAYILGLLTPLAALGILSTMTVAFTKHAFERGDPFVAMTGGPASGSSCIGAPPASST